MDVVCATLDSFVRFASLVETDARLSLAEAGGCCGFEGKAGAVTTEGCLEGITPRCATWLVGDVGFGMGGGVVVLVCPVVASAPRHHDLDRLEHLSEKNANRTK